MAEEYIGSGVYHNYIHDILNSPINTDSPTIVQKEDEVKAFKKFWDSKPSMSEFSKRMTGEIMRAEYLYYMAAHPIIHNFVLNFWREIFLLMEKELNKPVNMEGCLEL